MAIDPEAQAQLARLLADESLRGAQGPDLAAAIERGFERLVQGLVAEAAASDDVFDQASAVQYLRARIEQLRSVLNLEQESRLLGAVQGKIEAW